MVGQSKNTSNPAMSSEKHSKNAGKTSYIQIINKPAYKSKSKKLGELSFTVAMWATWVYLLIPFINILVWIFMGKYVYENLFQYGQYNNFVLMLLNSIGVIVIFFEFVICWAIYNKVKFHKNNRRTKESLVSSQDLSQRFHINEETLLKIQSAKEINFDKIYVNK